MKLDFLHKYAVNGSHYDNDLEYDKAIDNFIKRPSTSYAKIIRHADDVNIDKILDTNNHVAHGYVAEYNINLKSHHIDKIINHLAFAMDSGMALLSSNSHNLTDNHYRKIYDNHKSQMYGFTTSRPVGRMLMHHNIPSDIIDDVISNGSDKDKEYLANNPNLNHSHMNKLIDDPQNLDIAANENLHSDHIEKIINTSLTHKYGMARLGDLIKKSKYMGNFKPEHMDMINSKLEYKAKSIQS